MSLDRGQLGHVLGWKNAGLLIVDELAAVAIRTGTLFEEVLAELGLVVG